MSEFLLKKVEEFHDKVVVLFGNVGEWPNLPFLAHLPFKSEHWLEDFKNSKHTWEYSKDGTRKFLLLYVPDLAQGGEIIPAYE